MNSAACTGSRDLCQYPSAGHLCDSCVKKFAESIVDGGCAQCPESPAVAYFLIWLAMTIFLLVISELTKNTLRKSTFSGESSLSMGIEMILVKILISTLQLNSPDEKLDLKPEALVNIFYAPGYVVVASSNGMSPDCLLQTNMITKGSSLFFSFSLMQASFLPMFAVYAALFVWLSHWLANKFRRKFRMQCCRFKLTFILVPKQKPQTYFFAMLFLAFFANFPMLTRTTAYLIRCKRLGFSEEDLYLLRDLDTRCWTDIHFKWIYGLFTPMLLFYVIFLPMSPFLILWITGTRKILEVDGRDKVVPFQRQSTDMTDMQDAKKRALLPEEKSRQEFLSLTRSSKAMDRFFDPLDDPVLQRHKHFSDVFYFAYKGYKGKFWFWEAVVMFRKALLVMTSVTLAEAETRLLYLHISITIITCAICLQLLATPYSNRQLNRAELFGLLSSWTTFICAAFMEGPGVRNSLPGQYIFSSIIIVTNFSYILTMIVWIYRAWRNPFAGEMLEDAQQRFIYFASRNMVARMKEIFESGNVIIDAGDYDNRNAMHLAAAEGHLDAIRFLILHKADIHAEDRNKFTPLDCALQGKRVTVLQYLRSHQAQISGSRIKALTTKMLMAASVGDTAKLELFLMAGLSINSADYDMRTALHLAAAEDNSDCVEFLLKSKSDVNAVDRFGNTPLYDNLRARKSSGKHFSPDLDTVVAILREHGACLPDCHEITSLMLTAAQSNDANLIRYMLAAGANPNCCDYDNRTPLHLAAGDKLNGEVAKALLEAKADPNLLDGFGNLAMSQNHLKTMSTMSSLALPKLNTAPPKPSVPVSNQHSVMEQDDESVDWQEHTSLREQDDVVPKQLSLQQFSPQHMQQQQTHTAEAREVFSAKTSSEGLISLLAPADMEESANSNKQDLVESKSVKSESLGIETPNHSFTPLQDYNPMVIGPGPSPATDFNAQIQKQMQQLIQQQQQQAQLQMKLQVQQQQILKQQLQRSDKREGRRASISRSQRRNFRNETSRSQRRSSRARSKSSKKPTGERSVSQSQAEGTAFPILHWDSDHSYWSSEDSTDQLISECVTGTSGTTDPSPSATTPPVDSGDKASDSLPGETTKFETSVSGDGLETDADAWVNANAPSPSISAYQFAFSK